MKFDLATAVPSMFEPYVGDPFVLKADGQDFTLTLDNIKIFENSSVRDARVEIDSVEIPPRQAFALTWEGPLTPLLDPGTYRVAHAKAGEMTLYVSPFRQDQSCTLYESTFN